MIRARRDRVVLLGIVALLSSSIVGAAPALAREPSSADASTLSELPRPPLKARSAGSLDSSLVQVAGLFRTRGPEAARAFAAERGLKTRSPLDATEIAAVVEMSDPAAFGAIASRHGLSVVSRYNNLFEVNVPLQSLEALASETTVRSVAPPAKLFPLAISEGVASINASAWNAAGIRGAGAKVAIVDIGFVGYSAKLGSELPASVNTSCTQSPLDGSPASPHGTAVAEIVYDIAPDAQFYLAAVSSVVQLGNAASCLATAGVHVINFSVGVPYDGPGNGTGTVNGIVNSAAAAGIVWVNGAGNTRLSHWSGPWRDVNADFVLEFVPSGQFQTVSLSAGTYFQATLRWNDPWGASCNDYDLYLFNAPVLSLATLVASSENFQLCAPDNPREQIGYVPSVSGTYYIAVALYSASGTSSFDLMVDTENSISYPVAANSIISPADNGSPGMMAVGAFNWSTNLQELYSSEGPTTDGRMKPDIAGPDKVTTATYGAEGFAGTSASSPHVTGAVALVKNVNPSWTPAQIKSFLVGRALDAGAAGPDNQYGAGRLWLGAAPPPAADLSISLTDSGDPVTFGGRLVYTLIVSNAGFSAATNVTTTLTLPATVTWIQSVPSQGSCSGTTTVSCSLGTLANGAGASVQVVVTAPAVLGEISASASVSATEADPNSANNAASQSTTPSAFADVLPSDWAYSQMATLLTRGITTGCYYDATTGERRYCPNDGVTRAQMAAFLIRTLGLTPYNNPTPSFSDVPSSYWAYGWIEALFQQGITTGCYWDGVERRYCPENFVPRDQMAVFLMRARALTQLNSPTPTFSDVPSSYWAYGWIERLYAEAVTTGCYWDGVERRYCPTNNVTRREMAVFIIRNWP